MISSGHIGLHYLRNLKRKANETTNNFSGPAAGIGGSVCVNRLRPVEAVGGGMTKDEALDLALEALEAHADIGIKSDKAITAIKQARALDKKAENTMIYKTFEQWKNGNVLEHGVPRTEYYSEDQLDLVEMGWNYGYDAGRAVEQALDKKAENARELGLDYEPVQEPVAIPEYIRDAAKHLHENRFEPSFMVRAIVGWINGTSPAHPSVPDAIHHTDLNESLEYIQGWNDCRQAMLEMMK